jgi:hypothetical protein
MSSHRTAVLEPTDDMGAHGRNHIDVTTTARNVTTSNKGTWPEPMLIHVGVFLLLLIVVSYRVRNIPHFRGHSKQELAGVWAKATLCEDQVVSTPPAECSTVQGIRDSSLGEGKSRRLRKLAVIGLGFIATAAACLIDAPREADAGLKWQADDEPRRPRREGWHDLLSSTSRYRQVTTIRRFRQAVSSGPSATLTAEGTHAEAR